MSAHGAPEPRRSSAYALTRGALATGGALAGFAVGQELLREGAVSGPVDLVYLTLAGLLVGWLAGRPLAAAAERAWERARARARRVPPEAVVAAGTGATVALLISVLLNNVLASVPGFSWLWSLLIATGLVAASAWFFVVNRRLLLPLGRGEARDASPAARGERAGRPKMIDTSAIIDGRIADVLEAGFLDGEVLVPRFVLLELQRIADSDDPLRRKRGRRGLEVLDRMAQDRRAPTRVVQDDPEGIDEVDEKLLQTCLRRGADLITTDYNLDRVAALQGVRVLNVNRLANSVKASYLPGERLTLSIVKRGREAGQGLAYLEDGTMVVVDDAGERVGEDVETVVTSNLQTNMGRMIFAKPAEREAR